jgi:CheY-like chemotaxis protein
VGDRADVSVTSDRRARTTVLVVDDDEWMRRGMADGLRSRGDVAVVDAISHEEVDDRLWDEVDVLLIDPERRTDPRDRYAGLHTIERFRAARPLATVVAVSWRAADPLFRLRAAEVGATTVHLTADITTVDGLLDVVDGSAGLPPVSTAELVAYGLDASSKVDLGVRWLLEGRAVAWVDGDVEPTRRQMIGARETLAKLVGIQPVGAGSGAVVERRVPSWRQIVWLMRSARGLSPTPRADAWRG